MTFRLFPVYRLLLILALGLMPLFGHAASAGLVVGQVIDLTGPDAAIGRDYVAGIRTAFDAINAAGGINGKRVTYLVRDDGGDPNLAVKAVTELIDQERVDHLLGGVGDAATKAIVRAPAFKRSGLTLYAALANLEAPRVHYWRPSYQQELRYLLNHFDQLGMRRVGVVYQESSITRADLDAIYAELRKRGMTVSGTVSVGDNGASMALQAKKLADSKPAFVLMIADTIGSGFFLKEFRSIDPKTFVAGTSLINLNTLREIAGMKAVEWTVFSQVVPSPTGSTSPLQLEHAAMMKKYRDEAVSSLTLEGFLVAKTLLKTLQPGPRHDLDLGGLYVNATTSEQRLSNYIDIALFKKGSGLVF